MRAIHQSTLSKCTLYKFHLTTLPGSSAQHDHGALRSIVYASENDAAEFYKITVRNNTRREVRQRIRFFYYAIFDYCAHDASSGHYLSRVLTTNNHSRSLASADWRRITNREDRTYPNPAEAATQWWRYLWVDRSNKFSTADKSSTWLSIIYLLNSSRAIYFSYY